jgi:hypothetical protein
MGSSSRFGTLVVRASTQMSWLIIIIVKCL